MYWHIPLRKVTDLIVTGLTFLQAYYAQGHETKKHLRI